MSTKDEDEKKERVEKPRVEMDWKDYIAIFIAGVEIILLPLILAVTFLIIVILWLSIT